MLNKINFVLRILIILGLILLAYLSLHYKFGDCDKCEFKYNNTILNAQEFSKLYADECIPKENFKSKDAWNNNFDISRFVVNSTSN